MSRTQNRPLPLILARELASNVATPFLVLDRDGTLIFFNERAEQIIGMTPAELGEVAEEEWRGLLKVETLDGTRSRTTRRRRRSHAGRSGRTSTRSSTHGATGTA